MLRRQLLSHDDLVHPEYTHQTSPRKWTTHATAVNVISDARGSGYRPSWLYQESHDLSPPILGVPPPFVNWLGKKIIYWTGESVPEWPLTAREKPNRREDAITNELNWTKGAEQFSAGNSYNAPGYIHEYEIARQLRPNIYRIIFTDSAGNWRSKVNVDYSAGRANIFIGPDDTIIRVGFF